MMHEMIDSWLFTWVIVPALIFFARILDVSIGTLRLIFISKGFRMLAPVLGFFEVLIWLVAIRQILQHLDNYMCYLAYGLGFATGNYIGMVLDEKLSLGKAILRVFSRTNVEDMAASLRNEGYGVTEVAGEGRTGPVKILFSIVNKKDINDAVNIIHQYDRAAFYSIEEIGSSGEGYFRKRAKRPVIPVMNPFSFWRKSK
jgi:uncharacterized protein YebE (UPF0316 family)